MNEVESLALEAELEVSGTRGYSAYEIAKQHGFEGTEEEWLESLKGEDGSVGPEGPQGPPGITPDMRIGTVETLDPDEDAYANFIGTPAIPILNMGIPQGKTGNGIASWTKTGTSGLVDTYTITYTDGSKTILNVTNGKSIVSITKTTTSGLTDTYTILYNDNTVSTFYVQNGRSIVTIDLTSTEENVDTYTITYNDGTTSTYNVTNSTVTNQEFEAVKADVDKYKTLSKLLPKVEGEGSSIELNNTVEGVTMDITPKGATSQYTTTGKNLLPNNATSQTINGVTFSINEDKTVTVNGTNNGNTIFYKIINDNELPIKTDDLIINGCPTGGSSTTYKIRATYTEGGYSEDYGNSRTLTSGKTLLNVLIVITGGKTCNNLIFKPMIVKGSTATDYEEYTGGQPSPSPDYPQPIKVVTGEQNINISSKNLFDIGTSISDYFKTISNGEKISSNNTTFLNVTIENNKFIITSYNNSGYPWVSKWINLPQNKDVVISGTNTTGIKIVGFNSKEQNTVGTTLTEKKVSSSYTQTIFNTGNYNFYAISIYPSDVGKYFEDIQIEQGSTATSYTPYYSKDYKLLFSSVNILNPNSLEQGTFNYNTGVLSDSSNKIRTKKIAIKPNTTYTISSNKALGEFCTYFWQQDGETGIAGTVYSTSTEKTRTITTPSDAYFMMFRLGITSVPYTLEDDLEIQLEEGDVASNYQPYVANPLELTEITENYQDYIYGTPNNWYKREYIHKVVLDGSESYQDVSTRTNTIRCLYALQGVNYSAKMTNLKYVPGVYSIDKVGQMLENNFLVLSYPIEVVGNTINSLKTWLSTHNTTVYYVLATPTDTQITNTTLIEQLNNLYNATSQEGTTYITCSSASDDNEALQVKASTYKDISVILNPVVESEGE